MVAAAGLALLLLATSSDADPGTLRVRARFRDAPGIQSNVLEFLPAGTTVEVLEVLPNEWRRVQLEDGRVGFVWKEHFAAEGEVVAAGAADETVADDAPEGEGEATLGEEPLAASPSVPASAEDVARLRTEIERLAAAQETLLDRIGTGGTPGPRLETPVTGTPMDGTAGAAAVFLIVGALFGWIASRIAQRRRDRRPKLRL